MNTQRDYGFQLREGALRFLTRAIALAPASGDALEHLRLALEQRGRHVEAMASLETACRREPCLVSEVRGGAGEL